MVALSVFEYGRPASSRSVQYAFKLLRAALKWRARGGHSSPRIYDLSHSFICHRLEDWYAQGLDIDRRILAILTVEGLDLVVASIARHAPRQGLLQKVFHELRKYQFPGMHQIPRLVGSGATWHPMQLKSRTASYACFY